MKDAEVVHVAFYDAGRFSHAYPSSVYGPLKEAFKKSEWGVSDDCPSLVVVTVRDEWGQDRFWLGTSNDYFVMDDATPWQFDGSAVSIK